MKDAVQRHENILNISIIEKLLNSVTESYFIYKEKKKGINKKLLDNRHKHVSNESEKYEKKTIIEIFVKSLKI